MTWCTWDILNKIYDIIVPPPKRKYDEWMMI